MGKSQGRIIDDTSLKVYQNEMVITRKDGMWKRTTSQF